MMTPGNNFSQKRKATITGKAEETKVNFFNPKHFEEEETEEHKILETKVDPLEWNKELDRVYRELDKIEQEVDILKKQGADNSDFEEYLRHLELIIEMCDDIRESSH